MVRKIWVVVRVVLFASFAIALWNLYWIFNLNIKDQHQEPLPVEMGTIESSKTVDSGRSPVISDIRIAAVTCGNRIEETVNMMKSALILSAIPIQFVVFADDEASIKMRDLIIEWPKEVLERMKLDVHPITFPPDKTEEWKKLFKPCAAQRLFLPSLLEDVDSLLYVDTDTIFLTSPEKVWEHFTKMNSKQMAAVAPEHEDYSTGWYNRFARHPYYGALGVNSGVMLMNLTRMRNFGWEKYVIPIYQEYKTKITWGDQDIINIVFHFHPDKLYVYPCNYNFRPDHCMYMSVCKPAEEEGVYVLHGNRGSFHNEKQPAFKALYSAIQEFDFQSDLENVLTDAQIRLKRTETTSCGKMGHFLTKSLEAEIRRIQQDT